MTARNVFLPVLALALATLLQACSTRPEVRADADPNADLASYKTFDFFDRLATDQSAYTTIITTRLKEAARRELEKRGYRQSSTNPQLLVNFQVKVENQADVRSTVGTGFYGYRAGMYGMWGGYPEEVETVHYQDGTLAIDLVDASKQQLVWQGVAQGRISKAAMDDPGPAIDKVVAEIFAKYPVSANTATATQP